MKIPDFIEFDDNAKLVFNVEKRICELYYIMEEKVKITFNYTLKTIEKTDKPCKQCALSVGTFSCMSRELCKYTHDDPKVYYFNGIDKNL